MGRNTTLAAYAAARVTRRCEPRSAPHKDMPIDTVAAAVFGHDQRPAHRSLSQMQASARRAPVASSRAGDPVRMNGAPRSPRRAGARLELESLPSRAPACIPARVLVPAALDAAQWSAAPAGRALIAALVAGCEVTVPGRARRPAFVSRRAASTHPG